MKRFVEGEDRQQATLLPACLGDYVAPDNPARIIEAFVDELDLAALGFAGVVPAVTGRPSYLPATLLKIYIYGYLNRVPSSRRLERETQRNLELIWLTGRLMPDFRTIARAQWPPVAKAPALLATTCRWRWRPSIISSSHTR
jgi:transposase